MNGTADIDTNAAVGEGGFDPSGAAELLKQTERQAQREFEAAPPILTLMRAAVLLLVYGAIWLSVRGQHPYKGPTGPALLVVVVALMALVAASAPLVGGAIKGLGGRAHRQRRAVWAAGGVAYVGIYVFEGALYHAHLSHAIVYGTWAAAGPVLVIGPLIATYSAMKENWPMFGVGIAFTLIAAGAAFTGPVSVWAIVGLGTCLAFLCQAAAQLWLRDR